MNCKSNNLKLLYTNAGSLIKKLDELKNSIDLYEPDIICIAETRFDKSIEDAEVSIQGFNHFRGDRNFKVCKVGQRSGQAAAEGVVSGSDCSGSASGGGGSIIYVRDYLRPILIKEFNAPDSLALSIQTDIGDLIIACVYRTQALTDAQNRHLIGSIKNLSKVNSEAEVIVVGDLNLPDVCWVSGTVEGPIGTSNKTLCLQQLYMDFITEEGLTHT